MNKKIFFLVAFVLPLCAMAQTDSDKDGDLALWTEVDVSKKLSQRWSIDGGLEMRMGDNVSKLTRVSAGVSAGYKVCNWLRLGAGYDIIHSATAAYDKPDYNKKGEWNGLNYKHTADYTTNRHRLHFDIGMQAPKLWRCIRLSARVRYQFTWRPEQTLERWKYKFYSSDKAPTAAWTELTDDGDVIDHPAEAGHLRGEMKPDYPEYDPKLKAAKGTHYMRSRVKVEYEKKRCRWNPFVSYEFCNDLADGMTMSKTRLSAGTAYKFNKQHEVSLAYIYNTEYDEPSTPDIHSHIISVSYEIKF